MAWKKRWICVRRLATAPALESGAAVEGTFPITNVDRAVGTILGSEVTRKYGRRIAGRHDSF